MLRRFGNNKLTRFVISVIYKSNKRLPITVFGQDYIHPFGLAAGMDKKIGINEVLWVLSFAEIGGITMLEQSSNPKPRMFRSSNLKALVNRMVSITGSEKMQSNTLKFTLRSLVSQKFLITTVESKRLKTKALTSIIQQPSGEL